MLEQFEPGDPIPPLTVEQYLRTDPQMPREAAEYYVARLNRDRAGRQAEYLELELPGVGSVGALQELSPAEVFVVWLQGRSPRQQLAHLIRRGLADERHAASREMLPPMPLDLVPIGWVADGPEVGHVLYRHNPEEVEEGPPDGEERSRWQRLTPEERELERDIAWRMSPMVATCRRQPDGGWRLLVDHDFLKLGSLAFGVGGDDAETAADDTAR